MKSCLLSEMVNRLWNPRTINYNHGRSNCQSIVCSNTIVGYHALHNVANAYVNVVNAITTFVEPTPPTNITTNETILTQYIIKQGLVFKRMRLQ